MSKIAASAPPGPRPEFGALLRRVASDGRRWADAELALARTELGDLRRRCLIAAILAVTAFGAVLCALGVLAQAGVAAAAPYLSGDVAAGFAIGAFLLVFAGFLIVALRHTMNWRAESLLFGWRLSEAGRNRKSQ